MIKYLIPSVCCYPLPVSYALKVASHAGFDGVEIFRLRTLWRYPDLETYRELARSKKRMLHFHETWSVWYRDMTHPSSVVPALWGALIPENATLQEQFEDARELVVAFPHHLSEIIAAKKPNWAVQTNAFWLRNGYNVPFQHFIDAVREHQIPVVFDTQHYLEYQNDRNGVEHLSRNRSELMKVLERAFEMLKPQIVEIHLNNFDPDLGHSRGRNLWPRDGVLDLKEFCSGVKQSGWQGTVVPELHPRFFSRLSFAKNSDVAKRLKDDVSMFFDR